MLPQDEICLSKSKTNFACSANSSCCVNFGWQSSLAKGAVMSACCLVTLGK